MFGYALLGAGWLIIKTEGSLQDWARALGRRCLIGTVLAIAVVSLWTPLIDAAYRRALVLLAAHRLSVAGAAHHRRPGRFTGGARSTASPSTAPFIAGLGLFVMSYLGIAISLWPMIVPGHFTLDQAAASQSTQAFLLIGTLFLLPVILVYTAWSYWVFRGKARADIGYHH